MILHLSVKSRESNDLVCVVHTVRSQFSKQHTKEVAMFTLLFVANMKS